METKKQTAVEWLVDTIFNEVDLKDAILKLAIQQAIAMEKEQIENACDKFANSIDFTIEDFEQYYTSTYGQ